MDLTSTAIQYADAPPEWNPVWHVQSLWQANAVNALLGAPKTHKSMMRRYLLACALSGESAFGLFPVEKKVEHALVLIAEDHEGNERNKMDRMFAYWGMNSYLPNVEFNKPLGLMINSQNGLQKLLKHIDKEKFDLVTIDPLIEFHGAEENSATEMARVALALRSIAAISTASYVHHTAKPPQDGFSVNGRTVGEQSRGSTVMPGANDNTIWLKSAGADVRHTLLFESKGPKPDPLDVDIDLEHWIWRQTAPLTEDGVLKAVQIWPGTGLNALARKMARRKKDVGSILNVLQQKNLVYTRLNGQTHEHYPTNAEPVPLSS